LADSEFSPAKVRNAVLDKNIEVLSTIVMARNMDDVKELTYMLTSGMGLTEHVIPKRKLYDKGIS